MKYGCIGEHLSHSFSKEIHSLLADYEYEICEIAKKDLDSFMRQKDFSGINVTIPYKQEVIPYLDEISPDAEKIGAVNTIINKGGKLFGFNTDFGGMKSLINRCKIEVSGKKALILGTGGTSKTAKAVLSSLGAKEIIVVSRSVKPGSVTREIAEREHTDADIIINATPCGMFPEPDAIPIDISRFDKLSGVIDAIYNPLRSKLVLEARKRNIAASGGLYMLVEQARLASEIFLGIEYDKVLSESVYRKIYNDKQNIILTGMPSSGKSTIGKKLANDLGRAFFDIDDEIEKREQKKIKDIFAEKGEKYFRDIEEEVIFEISKNSSAVISTGGGSILRERNIASLRSNGMIFFIFRPLDKLMPTDSRPLFNEKEKLAKLWNERKEIYENTADFIVHTENDINKAVKIIKEEISK